MPPHLIGNETSSSDTGKQSEADKEDESSEV